MLYMQYHKVERGIIPMKNSDMKVIAIILSIALFFTIVTSNAVSIASVVFLAKDAATVQEGTADATGDATNTDANSNNANTNTNTDTNSTVTPETTAPAADSNANANTNTDANANANTNTNNDANANQPAGNTGSLKALSEKEAFKMFQDAATDIKKNGSASYNCKSWQVVKEMNIGNDTLANIIAGFVTSEEKAETKVNEKGTDDSKNRMPASNCTMSSVKSVSSKVSGSNYIITIVMKDQINPTAEDTDGISLMSRDLLYMKAVTETIETNGAIKLIVKGLNKAEMNYQAFTITATMTADGKFVEITHKCDAKLTAEAALTLGGTLGGDGVLEFNARFWDFKY